MNSLSIGLLLPLLLLPQAQGAVTFIKHLGSDNPATEGWTAETVGGGINSQNAIANDQGLPTWRIYGVLNFAYYYKAVPASVRTASLSQGWKLTFRARAGTGSHNDGANAAVSLGGKRWDVNIANVSASGLTPGTLYRVNTFGGGPQYTGIAVQTYTICELVYDPTTQTASLYVDGTKVISGFAGHTNFSSSDFISFGASATPGQFGTGHFNHVRFEYGGQAVTGTTSFRHFGNANPVSAEGFDDAGVATSSGIANDQGVATWQMFGQFNSGFYSQTIPANVRSEALTSGWKLSFRMRAGTASHNDGGNAFVSLGGKRWDINVANVSALGVTPGTLYRLSSFGGGPSYQSSAVQTYTLCELVYDPATQTASLYVDGLKAISNFAGHTNDAGFDFTGFGVGTTPGQSGTALVNFFRFEYGSQLGTGLRFVPVSPCRMVDTRNPSGPFGGPALAAGVPRKFTLPQSGCSIPASAAAYSINATVVPAATLGYLTLWPDGSSQPFVSTLNSFDGRIKANAAIVPAGTNGAINAFATDNTDLILDINGYFIDPALDSNALAFYPLTPCRIVDTRLTGGIITSSRDIPFLSSNCGIPSTAQAYSINATAVPPAALGFLTLWPTGQAQPFVSTLNSLTGAVVANAAIVKAGANGSVSAFASNNTHLVIDINGYFAPAGAANAQRLFTVTPCRALDTRNAAGEFGGPILTGTTPRTYRLPQSGCGLPSTASAYVLNATVVPPSALAYLTLWPANTAQPFVSTLNAFDGAVTSNMAIVPATSGAVSSYSTSNTHLILDTSGYFAP